MAELPNPIVLRTNRDWRDTVNLAQVAPDETQTPLDLTGAVMRMQMRRAANQANVYMTLSTANGRLVITDAENGGFAFNVDKEEIASALPAGAYVCDLLVTIGELDIVPLVRDVLVEQGVTR